MKQQQARMLGELIRQARKRKGLGQAALAKKSGSDLRTIARIEEGQSLNPEINRLALIADALDIEPQSVEKLTDHRLSRELVGTRVYFRAKHGFRLSDKQCREIEAIAARLHQEHSWSEKADQAAA